jgi:rubredoxin
MRTFGVCFGIQTRPKSEVFGSIIIRKKPMFRFGHYEIGHLYDILYTEDFNPNSRKLFVFERNLPKSYLGEQLRRICKTYLRTRIGQQTEELFTQPVEENSISAEVKTSVFIHQCKHCQTIYDATVGEPENGIVAGTAFADLPKSYVCPLCESPKGDFVAVEKTEQLVV